jgi:hypothetical protein
MCKKTAENAFRSHKLIYSSSLIKYIYIYIYIDIYIYIN